MFGFKMREGEETEIYANCCENVHGKSEAEFGKLNSSKFEESIDRLGIDQKSVSVELLELLLQIPS
jgi:hypothetical protein